MSNTIMTEKPKLHPMAAAAIKSLEAKGLNPTPAHVLWIQDAALRMRRKNDRRIAELIDWPIPCGGVSLYPFSIGAMEWMRMLDEDLQNQTFVQAFACAHAKDRAALSRLTERREIIRAVREWRKHITASESAVSAVLNTLIGRDSEMVEVDAIVPRIAETQERAYQVEFGAFILALCAKYPGTMPDYWAFQVSFDFACSAMARPVDGENEEGVTGRDITMGVAFRSIMAQIERELIEAKEATHG